MNSAKLLVFDIDFSSTLGTFLREPCGGATGLFKREKVSDYSLAEMAV